MRHLLTRGLPLALVLVLFSPSRASAGVILITHGDTIKPLGDLRSDLKDALRKATGKNLSVGFKYSSFGVFWLDLWTWGGEYCLYEGNNYEPIPLATAALLTGKSEDELGKPFFYRFPLGLLIIGGCVVVFTPMAMLRKGKERRIRRLLGDERYQAALQLMRERDEQRRALLQDWQDKASAAEAKGEAPPPKPELMATDDGFEAAVDHLAREGIPREEAEQNLTAVLTFLENHAPAGS